MTQREVFLYFQDGNDDAYCYPLKNFIGFQHAADGTLLMRFVSVVTGPGATTEIDTVTLTLASNKEKDAINDIVNLINSGPHSVGVITCLLYNSDAADEEESGTLGVDTTIKNT